MLTNRQLRRNERARDKAKRARYRQEAEWKRQRGKHRFKEERPVPELLPRRMSLAETLATGLVTIVASLPEKRT